MGALDILVSGGLILICIFCLLAVALYMRYVKLFGILEKAKHDRPNPQEGPDVIIVGAGVIGSAMATVLARDGHKVTVVERSMKIPDRIAGEAMLGAGLIAMKKLGIDVSSSDVEGTIANKVMLYPPGREPIMFPLQSECMDAVNGKLVDALRKVALNEKRCSIIEGNVLRLVVDEGAVTGIEYRLNGEENTKILRAPLTIVADGSNSNLRSINIPRKPVPCNYQMGLEVEGVAEDCYSVLPTSLGVFTTMYLTPRKLRFILATNTKWEKTDFENAEKEIPEYFRAQYKRAVEDGPIRSSPVLYLPPSMKHVPGVITIGDAHSVRNAIGASGMMVGMMDVCIWRDLLKGIPDLYNYKAMFAAENAFAVRRQNHCFSIDLFGWCIRNFFLPETDGLKLLGALFGVYITTIRKDYANIFTGVDTRPQLLLFHLAKVTMISMYEVFRSRTCCGLPCGFYQAGQVFCSAFATIVPHIMSQIRSMVVMK